MNDKHADPYADRVVCIQQLSNIRRVYAGIFSPYHKVLKDIFLALVEAKNGFSKPGIIWYNWRN